MATIFRPGRAAPWALASLLIALSASPGSGQIVPEKDIPRPATTGGRVLPGYAPLLAELRQGGLVLVVRHDRTDLDSRWDLRPYAAGRCDRQRNLSRVGRVNAEAMGAALKALGIPVGPVLSSPYCRARDTARLAFGRVDRLTPGLIGPDGKERTEADVRRDVLALIREHARPGSNLIMVGHHGTIMGLTDAFLDEGDALILRPRRDGPPDVIAHMPAARWDELIREEQRRRAGI